jgi:hypothetical protein
METAKTSLSQGLKERKKSKLKPKKKKRLFTATPAAGTLKLVIGKNTRPKKKSKNEIGMRESNKQRVCRRIRRSRRESSAAAAAAALLFVPTSSTTVNEREEGTLFDTRGTRPTRRDGT